MSAIAGLISLDGRGIEDGFHRMCRSLAPNDPERLSVWKDGRASLARALVKLVPEDELDRQPLEMADGSRFVGDVRLDNRSEVAESLGLGTLDAGALCDAELAARALRAGPGGSLPGVLGEFALASWSPVAHRLVLARDAMAMRPLYYRYEPGRRFAFASAARVLHSLPGVSREVDERAIADFLGWLPQRSSYYRGISELGPGELLVMEDGELRIRRWHRFDPDRRVTFVRDADYVDALLAELERAVRARLRSRDGIGAHLSSGLDSGSVVATAAPLLAAEARGLTAFTAAPGEAIELPETPGFHNDEMPGARALASRHPNIEHVRVESGGSPVAGLRELVRRYDAPLSNLSNLVWLRRIEDSARLRGISVLLTGSMGNLTISWDGRFLLSELVAEHDWRAWLREASSLRRAGAGARGILTSTLRPLFSRREAEFAKTVVQCAHPDLIRRTHLVERAREGPLAMRRWDSRRARIPLLTSERWAPWAAGTEAAIGLCHRDPTADLRLVELCLAIPEAQFRHQGVSQSILKRAMQHRLPDEVLSATTRGMQAPDYLAGVRASLPQVRDLLRRFERSPLAAGCLDLRRMTRAADLVIGAGAKQALDECHWVLLRGIGVGVFLLEAEGGWGP